MRLSCVAALPETAQGPISSRYTRNRPSADHQVKSLRSIWPRLIAFAPAIQTIHRQSPQTEEDCLTHYILSDQEFALCGCSHCCGSPPRVWGSGRPASQIAGSTRFTPTRVGISVPRPALRFHLPVHPHACGDQRAVARFAVSSAGSPHTCGDQVTIGRWRGKMRGSPPRVWGSVVWPAAQHGYNRFTPTRVGISS